LIIIFKLECEKNVRYPNLRTTRFWGWEDNPWTSCWIQGMHMYICFNRTKKLFYCKGVELCSVLLRGQIPKQLL